MEGPVRTLGRGHRTCMDCRAERTLRMPKAMRGSALVALILVAALAIIVSPAFATTLNTDSSVGNASPFITPSTNTRSLYTGRSTDTQLTLPTLGSTVMCRESQVSGYASTTHTQIRLTSVSFGNVADPRNCTVRPAGTVDVQPITCTATSRDPWHLHVRRNDTVNRSASGTVNLTSSCTVRITIGGRAITISVDANQSCRPNAAGASNTYTYRGPTGSITVNCVVLATLTGAVRASTNSTFTGVYTVRPDTRTDPILVVTDAS
jgi:hypothetical protein